MHEHKNLLIPYIYIPDHKDPLFEEFTYGEVNQKQRRADTLKKKAGRGKYIFFHTSLGGKKLITAYYVADRVEYLGDVLNNKALMAKYKNPHIEDYRNNNTKPTEKEGRDTVILFGDPIESKILKRPLLFDRTLAEKLSLDIPFPKYRTKAQAIVSATRPWRELTDKDVDILIKEIEKIDVLRPETILTTDEVKEVIEKDIEGFIEKSPDLIGKSLKLTHRQRKTQVGRIDLFFEDKKGKPIIVELKLDQIGRDAINQLRKYMNYIKKEYKKETKGVVVCKGVMPAFEKDFKKLKKDIRIFCYGWQLKVYPWE